MNKLQLPIKVAVRTTPTYMNLLSELNIHTVEDMLMYYPRTYEDQSQLLKLHEIPVDSTATIRGIIIEVNNMQTRNGKTITRGVFVDELANRAELVWFNQKYLANTLPIKRAVYITGKLKYDYGKLSIQSPTVELIQDTQLHTGRIVPIYREHSRLNTKWFREKMHTIIGYAKDIRENLPSEVIELEGLISRKEAIENIHFPQSQEILEKARDRLAFEELYFIQKAALEEKQKWQDVNAKNAKSIPMEVDFIKTFFEILPFEFTQGQKIALFEILKDMEKPYPMSRLLEGDVGSGKTVVIVAAALNAFKAGYQTVIMAPTEVLARQHYATISKLMEQFLKHDKYQELMKGEETPSNIGEKSALDLFSAYFNQREPKVGILTGSVKGKKRKEVNEHMQSGEIAIVVGTHALIQEGVMFSNLGLVVIDEQHRFGVEQRERLKSHGCPHFLNMTATPIPRSLALTAYGDQDLSVIDEMPPGRKEIITKVVPAQDRLDVYEFMHQAVKKGRQIYIICPLIDESDTLEVKSAIKEQEILQTEIFPDLRIGLMHGKLSPAEKAEVMNDFKNHELDILVSTSVIEVGIDVPNSSIIAIEDAQRFGLSQLHQFRGRVGRGEHQSYCFLFTQTKNQDSLKRLKYMEQFSNGFKLAEIDLKLRGPGEVYGIRQSGVPDLRIASLGDTEMVVRVKKALEHSGA